MNYERSLNWQQKWFIWEEIGMGKDLVKALKLYTDSLKYNNAKLEEYED